MTKYLDGVLDRVGVEKLVEIIIDTIIENTVKTANVIPSDTSKDGYEDIKNHAATVEAVYNAMRTINHAALKFVKSTDGKNFEEMMTGTEPHELTFYVFKEGDTDNEFDLFIYDSQQGKYVNIGKTTFPSTGGVTDLSGYWSKDELDITEYIKSSELDLSNYVNKNEVQILTVSDVEEICNRIITERMGTTSSETV